jgi:transposase
MEKYAFFIGIDISKAHLDIFLRNMTGKLASFQAENSVAGVRDAIKVLSKYEGFKNRDCLVCLEHTGIYGRFALEVLNAKGFAVWHESPVSIRNGAGGIQRGKNDKVDAARITEYAFNFRAKARLWEPPRKVVSLLADLLAVRCRLLEVVKKLRVPLKEIQRFKDKGQAEAVRVACGKTLAQAEKDVRNVKERILAVIEGDQGIKRLYDLITSVRGVGFVTATSLIVATNEFKDIGEGRKLACHAGCAPFDHQSGSSVRGRSRVSHKANKRLKSLLHMCACSAIQVPGELRDYFERKIAQGKCKFVVLNAVRNKIIHRICACVRDGRKYSATPNAA